MSEPLQPSLRLVVTMVKWPIDLGTEVFRWSVEPLADVEFTEGRIGLNRWGTLDHALSTLDGNYDGSSIDFELLDHDGYIGGLLGTNATAFWLGREATVELLSTLGRQTGLEWRPLISGRISDFQPSSTDRVRGQIRDMLSSEFGTLNLDRPIGRTLIGTEHYQCPVDVIGRMYPIIIGEHSDEGSIDRMGGDAAQGAIPLVFCGMVMIKEDGSIAEPGTESFVAYMNPPVSISASVVGGTGSTTYTYSVSAIVDGYGETAQSPAVTVSNGPAVLSATNYIHLTWTNPPEYGPYVSRWRVHGRVTLVRPARALTIVAAPAMAYDDNGRDAEKFAIAPKVGTAQGTVPVAGVTATGWGKMLIGLGAVKPTALFGSDLGGVGDVVGTTRDVAVRVRIPLDHPDVISPYLENGLVNPAWPLANPWLEVGGIRATYIGVRGPLLNDHINGVVTLAANVVGLTATGDDHTTEVVDRPGQALKLFLNEFIFKSNGSGYSGGSFGPLEKFASTDIEILKTSTFDDYDDKTREWIPAVGDDPLPGAGGYKAQWYIDDKSVTVRAFLQWFCQTFGCFIGTENYGQIALAWIDEATDLTTCARHREHVEILDVDLPRAVIGYDQMQSARRFSYHWLPDSQSWRNGEMSIVNIAAQVQMQTSHREPQSIELRCSNDTDTVVDSQGRQLQQRAWPIILQDWTVGMSGIEVLLGSVILLTHSRGGGRGPYNAHPFMIMRRSYNPNTDRVKLTGMSLLRLLGTGVAEGGFSPDPMAFTALGTTFVASTTFVDTDVFR